MKAKTRQKINFIIDILMFLAIIVVSAIGLLLKYVLIHGSDRWLKYGDNVELTYLGMDRHQWGYIHWISSLVLVGLVVLHLVFHWTQIMCLVRRYLPTKKVRYASVGALLLVSIVLAISPFLLSVEVGEPVQGYRNEAIHGDRNEGDRLNRNEGVGRKRDEGIRLNRNEGVGRNRDEGIRLNRNQGDGLNRNEGVRRSDRDTIQQEHSADRRDEIRQHSEMDNSLDIQGLHTISEVAEEFNVPRDKLKEMLGIPVTASNNDRLGRLRRNYNFSMSDVERCVLKLQGKN